MAEEDFDISGLAAYMHMLPAQISRLADRGKLPGRRVGGEWRFSRPEIHHWLEDRIGLSDDMQLAEMESNLERTDVSGAGEVSIAELLPVELIAVPLEARTRGKVISKMTKLAAVTGMLWDPEKMAEAVTAREAMHPTTLDIGVALMHPRRPMSSILGGPTLALGITSGGIPFGGSSGLTDIFFLICSTSDHEHLRILARLSRVISDADWLAQLKESPDAIEAHNLITQRDAEITE
jgi:PTS system nitrogen regulatory IIA component